MGAITVTADVGELCLHPRYRRRRQVGRWWRIPRFCEVCVRSLLPRVAAQRCEACMLSRRVSQRGFDDEYTFRTTGLRMRCSTRSSNCDNDRDGCFWRSGGPYWWTLAGSSPAVRVAAFGEKAQLSRAVSAYAVPMVFGCSVCFQAVLTLPDPEAQVGLKPVQSR